MKLKLNRSRSEDDPRLFNLKGLKKTRIFCTNCGSHPKTGKKFPHCFFCKVSRFCSSDCVFYGYRGHEHTCHALQNLQKMRQSGVDFFKKESASNVSRVLFVQIHKEASGGNGKPIHYDLMVRPHKTLKQILQKICNAEGIQLKDYQVQLCSRQFNAFEDFVEDETIRLQPAEHFHKDLQTLNVTNGSRLVLEEVAQ